MANNRVQVKRTSVAGRTPNTTNAGNLQYIAAGELALNMTDQLMFTSDGTNLIYVGANQADQRITNTLTIDNNKPIRFKTSNTSAVAYFIQQNDDNFVFYTTNTVYGARPVWSIFANSDTSALGFGVPVNFTGANVNFGTTRVYANGTSGTAGQVLTSNGTATYWTSAGAASVNVDAQYTWTNTQTFSANISFGNNIGFATAAGIYFNGIADANWRLGRNTGTTTKFFYTGNTIDIIAAGSSLEGIAFGQPGANTYLETGYNGTYTRLPVYIGNSIQNATITNLTLLLQTNTTVNSTHTASLLQIANSTATSNLTATSLNIFANSTVNASLTSTTVSAANSTGNVQAVPTSVTVQNSTVNAVMGLQSVVIQSNTTVNGSITNALVQVANSTGNVQHTATSILAQTNTTVNSTHTASLVQVANSTSTANLVATGLQTYTNSTVNSTVTSSLVQVSNSTSTANLTALDLKIGATTVVNSTQVTATLHVGNVSGSYANITGQVNTATLFASTSANVGANVQLTTSALTVGNSTVNSTQSSTLMQVANSTTIANVTAAGIQTYTNSTVNSVVTASLVQVSNSTSTSNLTAAGLNVGANVIVNTSMLFIGNSTVNSDITSALLQIANSTSITNVVATGLQVYTNSTVNSTVSSSLVQVSNSTATSNLTAQGLAAGANVVANTTTLKVGNTTITTTNAVFGGTIAANGGIGSAGQVLTSGAAGNVYWSTVASGSVDQAAQYNWTNTHSFAANVSFTSNVGIGGPAQDYARLYVNTDIASDAGRYNSYMYYGDSNGTMTAARTKVGFDSQISNFNQNKSGDGLTTYDAYYYAVYGEAYSGSSSSSQNAYAYEMTGGKFQIGHYANGSGANTLNNARGIYGQVILGSQNFGTVNNAYGSISQIYTPSTTPSGIVNSAYGVFSQIDSNTNVTINNSYMFYGSRRGTVTGNNWGIYVSGESNNYISGNTYFNSNVGIGQGGASDTKLRMYADYGVDASAYGIFGYFLNTNTALTAARTRYGFQASLPNLSQNKNADGVTLYSTNYRAIVGDAWNGNSSSGGDARANEMIGGNFRVYQYANGSAANTLSTAKGSQNQMFQYGSGVVTSAYGTLSEVVIGNNSVTGNITTAYASRSTIDGNSGPAQIATGYLFYGDYKGTNTATKYGVYITGESNNYFSSNVRIQGASYLVGNVGIGVNAQTDTQLQSSITWTSDAALWNTYLGTVDSNTAMTAARTKHGFQSIMNNVNQNKSADGLTTYAATYRGISSAINNGNTVSGGNAYADEITAARFTTYNYANGTGANTVNLSRGSYVYYGHFGGQTGNVYGHQSFLEIGNSTVTGTITNAVAFNGFIGGNTLGTITTAYLFKGDYSDTNRPTTAWGVYISDESNNYFSNTVYVGANVYVNTTAFDVGNTIISTTNAIFGGTIAANGGIGSAGQVLTSGGAGNVYWATAAGGGSVYLKGGSSTVGSLATEGQNLFRVNANTLNFNTTFVAGENAQATGPLNIASGITLTVETGARVSIV